MYGGMQNRRRELTWEIIIWEIEEKSRRDVPGESEEPYLEISLTVALNGVHTWTGGAERNEESGSVFF
jgi:hypothetical protein